MKKNTLLALSLLFTLLLSIFACRKSIEFYVDGKEAPASTLLEAAKIWRSQHIISFKNVLVLRPYWDDAWTVTATDGKNFIIVPSPERRMDNKNLTIRRFFIFTTQNENILDGNILEFVAEKSDVQSHLDKLVKNMQSEEIRNYSGWISKYDINYQFINSYVFKDGKKLNIQSKVTTRKPEINSKSGPISNFLNSNGRLSIAQGKISNGNTVYCEPVIPLVLGEPFGMCHDALAIYRLDWIADQNGCLVSVVYNYLSHTCPNGAGTGDSGSGSSGGSGSGSGESSGSGSSDYTGGGNPPYGGQDKDCAGVVGGIAQMTECGCIGGTTGITVCKPDCGPNLNVPISWKTATYTYDGSKLTSKTLDDDFVIRYSVCADSANNVWRLRVASITGGVSILVATANMRNPFIFPPTTAAEAHAAVTQMKNHYSLGARGYWFTEAAIIAHENYHYSEWKCSAEKYWNAVETDLENLTVPLSLYSDPLSAENALKSVGATSKMTNFRSNAKIYWASLSDGPNSQVMAAGQLVLNQAISYIQSLASMNGWSVPLGIDYPSTGSSPCYNP